MAKFGFHKTPPLLALMTDFGERDSYVGTMKGVIHSICEEGRIVDLTHGITPQDVTEAAFVLAASYNYFPQNTIFACVVDPGVGTSRDIVCVKSGGRIFIAPDNGLLSPLGEESSFDVIRSVENQDLWLENVSTTFHGRDIFAPVAAHLAAGADLEKVGPKKDRIKDLKLPRPVKTTGGVLKGQVIHVDQFGNLITNVGASTLQTNLSGDLKRMHVSIEDRNIEGISDSYGEVQEGQLTALIGSSGYLEIAINQGSARDELESSVGTELSVKG